MDTRDGACRQVGEKFDLATVPGDWSVAGIVENPADNEINTVWTFARPLDNLTFRPAAYGGLFCLKPSTLRLFDGMLSRAPFHHAGDAECIRRLRELSMVT
jgi:hypothetical protein